MQRTVEALTAKGPYVWAGIYIGVIFFTVLSGYTTKLGVAMVIPYESSWIRNLLSTVFAVAAGCMMIGISLLLKNRMTQWRKTLVAIYFILLCISVFFNFNALYGVMEKRVNLESEAMELRSELVGLQADCKSAVARKYNLDNLLKHKAELAAQMELERENYERPGEGPIYHQLKREHDELVATDLKYAQDKVNAFMARISALGVPAINALDAAQEDDGSAKYHAAIQQGLKAYDGMVAEIRQELPDFNRHFDFVYSADKSDRPERALLALKEYWASSPQDLSALSSQEKANLKDRNLRLVIASWMSVVIDMPLFLFMIILSLPEGGGNFIGRIRNAFRQHAARKRRQGRQGNQTSNKSVWGG